MNSGEKSCALLNNDVKIDSCEWTLTARSRCCEWKILIDVWILTKTNINFYQEHQLGKLLPGYQADFVVIDSDQDPVENPEAFLTAKVAEVWVAGQQRIWGEVYGF